MDKIPTLFDRDMADMRHVVNAVAPGCEWVLAGEGVATRKYDGTCVLIMRWGNEVLGFARRVVKPGKAHPDRFQPISTDPATGKTVGWEPIAHSGFAKFFDEAVTEHDGAEWGSLEPGTYELCGPKINSNPEGFQHHRLVQHATAERYPALNHPQGFAELRVAMRTLPWEGIVWHHPDGRMAKLKTRDFPSDPSV